MNAIGIYPGTAGAFLTEIPEPDITTPDEVKLRVLGVGICGTDREEVAGGRAAVPDGQKQLVIGHEMIGQVSEVGSAVTRVRPGDYAVFTVRRGCGECLPCSMNRPDMCRTGNYRERGIQGLNGYQCEFVVDREQYVVKVPAELESVGVLTEPLSISEKALDEAFRIQSERLPDFQSTPYWFYGKRCLVAGLGPVGLLAALALRLRGAEVIGLDVVDKQSARPLWLKVIGGSYVDGREVSPSQVESTLGGMDLIFESTGVASLEFNLLDALGQNGVYVLTGIPGGNRPLEISGAELIRRLVLKNQVMVGSVNAARDHYQMAVDDLKAGMLQWGDHIKTLITHRYAPREVQSVFGDPPAADEIKAVIEWTLATAPK